MAQAAPFPADQKDAIELLEHDHRAVELLYEQYQQAKDAGEKEKLAGMIIRELSVHATIEEMVFYPAVRESVSASSGLVEHSLDEHQEVKEQLKALEEMNPSDDGFGEKLDAIMSNVAEHVVEEETEMFPRVRDEIDRGRLIEMGEAMEDAKGAAPAVSSASDESQDVAGEGLPGIGERVRDAVERALGS